MRSVVDEVKISLVIYVVRTTASLSELPSINSTIRPSHILGLYFGIRDVTTSCIAQKSSACAFPFLGVGVASNLSKELTDGMLSS